MDLRTQTSLIAGVLSLAIGSTVVLRSHRRRVHWLFAAFGATVGAWYLTAFLAAVSTDIDTYSFAWKTTKSWTGCRLLTVALVDGTDHEAAFRFK